MTQAPKAITQSTEVPSEQSSPSVSNSTTNRSRTLLKFSFLLIVLLGGWFLVWFFYLSHYESTDDAYANGNMVNINAVVPSSVIAYYADITDLVAEGQLIIELDRTEYELLYEKQIAALFETCLEVNKIYDTVKTNMADVEAKKAIWSKAKYDYDNRSKLVDSGAISNEDFIHARDDLLIAEWNFKQAGGQLQISYDNAGKTPPQEHPLIEQRKSELKEAYYKLQHCSIYAPTTGYIAQRSTQVGQTVNTNTILMAIVPMDYMWVDANYKETQLAKMRIGQPATVYFDLYGSDVEFHGKVLGIGFGTGSVFSIIPPQNATGNWIKIVQRIPVRISLDPEQMKKYPVRLGITANVDVDTTNTDLPIIASIPSTAAIRTTKIFNIDFTPVNALIDETIKTHLKVNESVEDNFSNSHGK